MMAAQKRPKDNAIILRPIFANEGVRVEYERTLQKWLKAMHDSMQLHIADAWKEQPPSIGFAQDDAIATISLRRTLTKWGKRWISKFDALSADLAKRFADKSLGTTESAMRAALAAAGFTVAFKPTQASLEAYQAVIASNVALIKSVPQIFLKDVQNSVWDSVVKGGDLATLSRSLQQNYGVSYRRAALIARTENFKAKALIESVRRKQLGISLAVWMHSHAGVTPRKTHIAMNGKEFDVSKGMYDSEEGEYVFPGQLINCRCSSRAILESLNTAP
jgi:SPP1 gp7 family putative phage head morphogenesis protein